MSEKQFKIQGRVKHCVIENLPVIARDGEAPECYVGGDVEFILKAMNSYPALYEAAKLALHVGTVIEGWQHCERGQSTRDAFDKLSAAIRLAEGKETV